MISVPSSRHAHVKTWIQRSWHRSRVGLSATGIAAAVLALRFSGALQLFELAAIDQSFRWRPLPKPDDRIVIVGVTEKDIQSLQGWPTNDKTLAALLNQIKVAQPRVIGLDIYREVGLREGHAQLQQVFQTTPNLIGIQFFGAPVRDAQETRRAMYVPPPPELAKRGQVGFNNTVRDFDQRSRRSLLYWYDQNKHHQSFALTIALKYLQPEGIKPKDAPGYQPKALLLGKSVLPRLKQSDSVYVRADVGGYQILADYRGPSNHFKIVPLMDVLERRVAPEVFRDRIVLVGAVAESLKDYATTPYSNMFQDSPEVMSGVELQANFISQLAGASGMVVHLGGSLLGHLCKLALAIARPLNCGH
jgi:CHASE2 domain-containing sensor protein